MLQAICGNICPVNEHCFRGHLADILAQSGQCAHIGRKAVVAHLENAAGADAGGGSGFCPLERRPYLLSVHLRQFCFIRTVRFIRRLWVRFHHLSRFSDSLFGSGLSGFIWKRFFRVCNGIGDATLRKRFAGCGLRGDFLRRVVFRSENGKRHDPQAEHDGQNESKRLFQGFLHNIILSIYIKITSVRKHGIVTRHPPL